MTIIHRGHSRSLSAMAINEMDHAAISHCASQQ